MPHAPAAAFSEGLPAQAQSQQVPPASPAPADAGPQLLPRPPPSSSASALPAGSSQAAVRAEQPWLHPSAFGPPPQVLAPYYYYRPLYEAYPPPYASPYAADPGPAALYYQVWWNWRAGCPHRVVPGVRVLVLPQLNSKVLPNPSAGPRERSSAVPSRSCVGVWPGNRRGPWLLLGAAWRCGSEQAGSLVTPSCGPGP